MSDLRHIERTHLGWIGHEPSTGVEWFVRPSTVPWMWCARRENERHPTLFGQSLAEIDRKLALQ